MDADSKAYVLSLVRHQMLTDAGAISWVPAHYSHRLFRGRGGRHGDPYEQRRVVVGGHYRRKALTTRALRALNCTCQLQDLTDNGMWGQKTPPPPHAGFEPDWPVILDLDASP